MLPDAMSAEDLLTLLERLAPLAVTIVVIVLVLSVMNRTLSRHWARNPDAQFRFQLIMLTLTLAGIVAVVLALPIQEGLRGQLLSLLGIVLSATIALSSTTFVGNIMAGIMLKTIKSARPGDFITVGELTGRITEMDLLHTEIQTEFRDLVTVPNLHLVTNPIKVVRASGTIVTAEVSLGYDIPRTRVADLLCKAAAESGLNEPFVHVRELGDFSILYRVAGLLENVESLISARSRLREKMLDALHAAGIEIVSPTFMSTRAYNKEREFIPKPTSGGLEPARPDAEQIAFDKATGAATLEKLKQRIESIDAELKALTDKSAPDYDATQARLTEERERLLTDVDTLKQQLELLDT